jgi:hypothetical protein
MRSRGAGAEHLFVPFVALQRLTETPRPPPRADVEKPHRHHDGG